jgi:hypothetical protein
MAGTGRQLRGHVHIRAPRAVLLLAESIIASRIVVRKLANSKTNPELRFEPAFAAMQRIVNTTIKCPTGASCECFERDNFVKRTPRP